MLCHPFGNCQVGGFFSSYDFHQNKRLKELETKVGDGPTDSSYEAQLLATLKRIDAHLDTMKKNGVRGQWEWDSFKEGFDKDNRAEGRSGQA